MYLLQTQTLIDSMRIQDYKKVVYEFLLMRHAEILRNDWKL